jgi:hypothetical protein
MGVVAAVIRQMEGIAGQEEIVILRKVIGPGP